MPTAEIRDQALLMFDKLAVSQGDQGGKNDTIAGT